MAKSKGSQFEDLVRSFFPKVFREMGFAVSQKRRQMQGTQNGFDVCIEFTNSEDQICHFFIECKDYKSPLSWKNIFDKILQLHCENYSVDGFIVLSPKIFITNIDHKKLPKLESTLGFPIKIWDLSFPIKKLFSLDPKVYLNVYGENCEPLDDRAGFIEEVKSIVTAIINRKRQIDSIKRRESFELLFEKYIWNFHPELFNEIFYSSTNTNTYKPITNVSLEDYRIRLRDLYHASYEIDKGCDLSDIALRQYESEMSIIRYWTLFHNRQEKWDGVRTTLLRIKKKYVNHDKIVAECKRR